ncbi:MAG TPA: hypothetical protein VFH91_10405 [Pyrinomonadaceae bacterium]|nr:hypothetical protein [Pyrinomonadaceae bacterium]
MRKLKLIAISVCLLAGLMFAIPNPVQPAPIPQGASQSPKGGPLPPPPPTPTPETIAPPSNSSSLLGKLLKAIVG